MKMHIITLPHVQRIGTAKWDQLVMLLIFLLASMVFALELWQQRKAGAFQLDDAYITFRYVPNSAIGFISDKKTS